LPICFTWTVSSKFLLADILTAMYILLIRYLTTDIISDAIPQSTAEPEPEPTSTAELEPEPQPTSEPEPEPEPTSEPEPEPEPTSEPEPEPEPEPTSEPEPEPETGPEPEPEPNGIPIIYIYTIFNSHDFSDNSNLHPMDCVDIVVGAAREKQSRILDYYTRDRSTPRTDDFYGGRDSLTAAVGMERDGMTYIKFRRRLDAGTH